jgi:hypothetical protein
MVEVNLDEIDLTFRPSSIIRIADGLGTDDENYVTEDGERLTDGLGVPIKKENVGGLIPLQRHNFHVNDDGIVVNENGEPVWILSDGERRDLFVPTTHRGEPAAIIRSDYPDKSAIISLVEQSQEFLK